MQFRRSGCDVIQIWAGEIPYRRKWQPTPVFLPGELHDRGAWQAAVHGGPKRVEHSLVTKQQQQCWLQHYLILGHSHIYEYVIVLPILN